MIRTALLATALAALALAACNKDKEGGDSSASGAKTTDTASAALELGKLGLHAQAPSGSKVGDAPVGEGIMVQGPGLVVTVEVASDSAPKTIDAAKDDASMYSPKNVQTETLGDGWTLTFENKGSMGANYFLESRREIGGKAYKCSTTASSKEQQQAALAFCKSLKP